MKEAWICVALIQSRIDPSQMGMPTAYGVGSEDDICEALFTRIRKEMSEYVIIATQTTQIDPYRLRDLYRL